MLEISIIVPVYNVEQYLSKCIDSILAQNLINIEIILINDGSTDYSGSICDKYAMDYKQIKVIHKKNGGLPSARNVGIKSSVGRYIGFVDSDDWIEPGMYNTFIEVMKNNEDVDICIGGMTRVYPDGKTKIVFEDAPNNMMDNITALKNMFQKKIYCWEMCDKLYRKELFEDFTCDENIKVGEDLSNNWMLFKKARKIYYACNNKYHYYMRESSLTNQYCGIENTMIQVFEKILVSNDISDKIISDLILDLYVSFSISHIKELLVVDKDFATLQFRSFQNLFELQDEKRKINMHLKYGMYLKDFGLFMQDLKYKINKIFQLYIKYKKVYVYGTGEVAAYISRILHLENKNCLAYIVSDNQMLRQNFMGRKVMFLSQLEINNSVNGIILAVDKNNYKIISKNIEKAGHSNVLWLDK